MKLVKHIRINQKEANVILNFIEFLEGLDDDCYDEFVQQIGCTSDFRMILDDFLENVDVEPHSWEN